MKILVLGYSGVAEQPGYVGKAKTDLELQPDVAVFKAGLGGMQPYHARYLFPQIIEEYDPNVVVLACATPAFRKFYNDRQDYRRSVLSILRECHDRGIRTAMLDLPRTDVDYSDDWVSRCHDDLCEKFGIPCHRIPLLPGMLRDEVHTTEYGTELYAEALKHLISQAAPVMATPEDFQDVPRYSAVPVAGLFADRDKYQIDRGGYKTDLVKIAAEETLDIQLPFPLRVCGFTALMGPRTGRLDLQIGKIRRSQMSYDQFCYYERLGAFVFDANTSSQEVRELSIQQSNEVPSVQLLKGTKDIRSRIGAIGHIFTETYNIK